MKLWLDSTHIPLGKSRNGWIWAQNIKEAKTAIHHYEHQMSDDRITIDLDSDFIEIIIWLSDMGIVDTGYMFRIHSTDFIARANIEKMIKGRGWMLI